MSYPVERFHAAVSVLAGHGHIKQRLVAAYEDNLMHIEAENLPDAVQGSFGDLSQLMHRVAPANGEGPICASVRKMSVDDANQCAQLVVEIYSELMRLSDSGQTSLPLKAGERPAPPFLVKSR